MVNYNNGKIYKITGTNDDGVEIVYIGSTTLTLCQRLAGHRDDNKRGKGLSSSQVIKCINHQITLIELCPCSSKEELLMRERFHIEQINSVNKRIPIRTDIEYKEYSKEYSKEYYIEHKEQQKQYHKQYNIEYKEQKKEYDKEYDIEHKEQRKEYHKEYDKEYYIEHKEQRKEYHKQYRIKQKLLKQSEINSIDEPTITITSRI